MHIYTYMYMHLQLLAGSARRPHRPCGAATSGRAALQTGAGACDALSVCQGGGGKGHYPDSLGFSIQLWLLRCSWGVICFDEFLALLNPRFWGCLICHATIPLLKSAPVSRVRVPCSQRYHALSNR